MTTLSTIPPVSISCNVPEGAVIGFNDNKPYSFASDMLLIDFVASGHGVTKIMMLGIKSSWNTEGGDGSGGSDSLEAGVFIFDISDYYPDGDYSCTATCSDITGKITSLTVNFKLKRS